MNNKIIALIIAGIIGTSVSAVSIRLDKDTIYYPNASVKSAVAKYKNGNYSGCLQELFSVTKKDPNNAMAYYYMALAYSHVDMKDDAVSAYDRVIKLNADKFLTEYATKGRDCLTGGPACKDEEAEAAAAAANADPQKEPKEELTELDKFIQAPYGNGLSPQINAEHRKKQLQNIQNAINKKKDLDANDVQKIKDFDTRKDDFSSSADDGVKVAQVSDEEVLNAIKTLREAGLTVNVQKENFYNQYQDPEMAQMSMLLGNNNNNNGNMMNMLPMLMTQAQKGENIDPRLMQAMMMNSMMSDFSFNTNNNDRY